MSPLKIDIDRAKAELIDGSREMRLDHSVAAEQERVR